MKIVLVKQFDDDLSSFRKNKHESVKFNYIFETVAVPRVGERVRFPNGINEIIESVLYDYFWCTDGQYWPVVQLHCGHSVVSFKQFDRIINSYLKRGWKIV